MTAALERRAALLALAAGGLLTAACVLFSAGSSNGRLVWLGLGALALAAALATALLVGGQRPRFARETPVCARISRRVRLLVWDLAAVVDRAGPHLALPEPRARLPGACARRARDRRLRAAGHQALGVRAGGDRLARARVGPAREGGAGGRRLGRIARLGPRSGTGTRSPCCSTSGSRWRSGWQPVASIRTGFA